MYRQGYRALGKKGAQSLKILAVIHCHTTTSCSCSFQCLTTALAC